MTRKTRGGKATVVWELEGTGYCWDGVPPGRGYTEQCQPLPWVTAAGAG